MDLIAPIRTEPAPFAAPTRLDRYATIILVGLLVGAVVTQTIMAFRWGSSSWNMTEWLINYAGGFVRRGLPGELLFRTSSAIGIPSNYLVIAISLGALAGLISYFLVALKDKYPVLVILSPVLIGSAVFNLSVVRKDMVLVLLLILCLRVERSTMSSAAKALIVNVVGVGAVLSHEAFIFMAFPALVMLRMCKGHGRTHWMSGFSLAPIAIAFFATAAFRGDAITAIAINHSLSGVWMQIDPQDCCFDRTAGAIEALGWTTARAMEFTRQVFYVVDGGVYSPNAWLATVFVCFFFLITTVRGGASHKQDGTKIALILLFQLGAITPLFVLGWDYGRWVFFWTTTSAAILVHGINTQNQWVIVGMKKAAFVTESRIFNIKPRPAILLAFGVPVCCWNVDNFFAASPLGFFVVQIRTSLTQ